MTDSLVKLAVLDCDGTIVDSKAAIVKSMTAAFEVVGISTPKPQDIIRIVGLNLIDAMSVLLAGERPDLVQPLIKAYKEIAAKNRVDGHWQDPLYPYASEVIQFLDSTGWLLGVATGKSKRGLNAVFDTHNIGHYFVTTQTSDFGPGKPAPDMLYRAMDETGAGPDNTVMIGDTTFDMEMAESAGIKAIGVSWGYHTEKELRDAGAHVIVDEYWQLPQALTAIVGGK